MDILEQYEKQHGNASRLAPKEEESEDYGFFLRLVMKFSGGRVGVRQATYFLIFAVVILAVLSFIFFFRAGSSPKPLYPEDARVPGTFVR